MTWSLFKGRSFFCPSLALLSKRCYRFNHAPVIPLFFWYLLQWHMIQKKKRLKILANYFDYFVNQGFLFSMLLTMQIKAGIHGAQKASAQQKWNTEPKTHLCGLFLPGRAVPAFRRSGAAAPCPTPTWGRCQKAALCCPALLPAVFFHSISRAESDLGAQWLSRCVFQPWISFFLFLGHSEKQHLHLRVQLAPE